MLFARKLPRASVVLLAVSLACAAAAALVMRAYAYRLDATRPDGGPPIPVVAAAHAIERGTTIAEEALQVIRVPLRFLPPRAVRDPASAVGSVVLTDLAEGEVVTRLRLSGGSAGPTASLVPAGMRAVELPVTAAVGVTPGDVVDVIATFAGGGAHTEVAGEAIEVLAVKRGVTGSFGGSSPPSGGAVGLVVLVTPEQAERLAFAAAFATLSVAVRGPEDATPGPTFTVP